MQRPNPMSRRCQVASSSARPRPLAPATSAPPRRRGQIRLAVGARPPASALGCLKPSTPHDPPLQPPLREHSSQPLRLPTLATVDRRCGRLPSPSSLIATLTSPMPVTAAGDQAVATVPSSRFQKVVAASRLIGLQQTFCCGRTIATRATLQT